MASEATAGDVRLDLPAILDMEAAVTLAQTLRPLISQAQTLELAASGVERCGTPAIQVLLAVANTLADSGRTLVLKAPSQELTQAFEDLGLGAELVFWRQA